MICISLTKIKWQIVLTCPGRSHIFVWLPQQEQSASGEQLLIFNVASWATIWKYYLVIMIRPLRLCTNSWWLQFWTYALPAWLTWQYNSQSGHCRLLKRIVLSFICTSADTTEGLIQLLQNLRRKSNLCHLRTMLRSSRNRRWDTNNQGSGDQARFHTGFHTEKLATSPTCLRMVCHNHQKNNRRITRLTQNIVIWSNRTEQIQK